MEREYTDDLIELAAYGIDETIDPDETVEVNLRDLMRIHQALGVLNNFFHQRMHYPDIESVHKFLGSRGDGKGYDLISRSYYGWIRDMIPKHIDERFDDNTFDSPLSPYYYKSNKG